MTEQLTKQLESTKSGGYSNPDEGKYWQPTVDKSGNGFAVIRFLPGPIDDNGNQEVSWVQMWTHGFQGPTGKWYIENCLSTIVKDDPVNEYNNKLWNSVSDDNSEERQQVRRQKRKLGYISNIYVVSDPANPDNEGKVFLFKYGKKIFDKINDAMNPPVTEYEQVEKVNPFDLWDGANFRIRIRKVDGYRNYDKSDFDSTGPLFEDDADFDKITEIHSLKEIVDESNFKSYDELKAKLYATLGLSDERPMRSSTSSAQDEDDDDSGIDMSNLGGMKSVSEPDMPSSSSDDDDDDDLAFFKNLAQKG